MLIRNGLCIILRRKDVVILIPKKMKKTFILFVCILSQAIAFSQVKEISAGITPYGKWKIRENKSKEDLLSHTYTISKPAFNVGFGWRNGYNETVIDVFYAKETPTLYLNPDTIPISFVYGTNHHFALHGYKGFTILYGMRVQIPIYFGIGLSYYSDAVPSKLSLDFGGRVRIRIYVTNKIALYVGGNYLFGFNGNKNNKYIVHQPCLEAGLMFNF